MSLRHTMAFLMATQFIAADFAAATLGNGTENFNSVTGIGSQSAEQSIGLAQDTWYSLPKTVTVNVLELDGSDDNLNIPSNTLLLVEGTEFNVLEISPDNRFALIGVDEDGLPENNAGVDADAPTIAWVSIAELTRFGMEVVDAEGIEIEGLSQVAQAYKSEFVATELARRGGGRARRRGGRGRRGRMTYCLRDVRLTAARYSRSVPQGITMASRAYPKYKAKGWRPTSYSPSNPRGTTCFFGGGRSCGHGTKCGHAAIKISSNAWKGAGVRPTPFLPNHAGKTYHLQGCLAPPGR